MKGLQSKNLVAIVDFLYRGTADVFQENLDDFLSIAEEFELKGLMGENVEAKEREKTSLTSKEKQRTQMNTKHFTEKPGQFQGSSRDPVKSLFEEDGPFFESDDQSVALANFETRDLQELDEKVKSMMEKSQNKLRNRAERASVCKICGKEGQWVAIRDHIEANHLEGISLPCNICGNILRSRSGLKKHKAKNHKNLSF